MGTPSVPSQTGMISVSQHSRRTADAGSGRPSSVSQMPRALLVAPDLVADARWGVGVVAAGVGMVVDAGSG
jgi:hypothetical protein